MSRISILKSGLIASACVAGLTLTACASSSQNSHSNSRYGDGSVYDYESGGNCNAGPCGNAVVAAPVVESRYGSATVIGGQQVSSGVVYADCSVVGGMNCNAQPVQQVPVYTQPAPVYQAQQSYGAPVACPAGTTPNGDGTCMESGSGYSTGSTYTGSTYSGSSVQSYGEPVACPSGTTPNGDGSCMESGSGYSGSYSSGSTTSTYSGGAVSCPSGTTDNGDGTCMEGSGYSAGSTYSGSSVQSYGEPVSCPSGTTPNGDGTCMSTGYVPTYSNPTDYMPIRK